LSSRTETDKFKEQHEVKSTPQTFIDSRCIGGYDELRAVFGMDIAGQNGTTYTPIIVIFSMAALLTFAIQFSAQTTSMSASTLLHFIAVSMVMLALHKLKSLFSFTNSFNTYDLLAMRNIRYVYLYPFIDTYAGIGMIAALPTLWVVPVSLFICTVGAISFYKAVYIDKRELKCA
jgi:hypothetical protein